MSGYLIAYTGAFLVYGLMEVLGLLPQEVKSAGISLTGLFGNFYGDLNEDFIMYQLRRTTITTLVHSSLPLFYCLGLSLLNQSLMVTSWVMMTFLWMVSLVIFLLVLAVVLYWYHNGWQNHPLKVQLNKTGSSWSNVSSSINLEFRDLDKFVSELGGTTVIVTESWIIQCNLHTVDIIHQRDAVLNVASSDEHQFSLDGQSKQFITINVNSINSNFKSFDIRLNSYQYTQLHNRLLAPIRVARNVVIHQSLSDRFAAAFAEQVERNGEYFLPQGSAVGSILTDIWLVGQYACEGYSTQLCPQPLEPCVGCLQALPQVKLQKLCSSEEKYIPVKLVCQVTHSESDEGSECRQCFCRPMWCLSCMSKWFAARQDQHRPEGWMAARAPCPMCRATFCMLDIQKIHQA